MMRTACTFDLCRAAVVAGLKNGAPFAGHHLSGTVSSREEAPVVATILRLFNPN